ncbi:MAG: DUF503 domain-containing protein [Anaerolineaceae bacterium]|nr:DUF503 domain-containing protein [Anaerolineaceae bacterium]
MIIGILSLHFFIPGCTSLKEKRSHIKPVLAWLHREFNISVVEVDRQDMWQEAVIACALISNNRDYTHTALQQVISFTEKSWPDMELLEHHIELV